MAEKASQGWTIPWSAVIAIIIAGGGVYLLNPPLISERPVALNVPTNVRIGARDVEARAWQDPFKAVQDYQAKMPATPAGQQVKLHDLRLLSIIPKPQPSEAVRQTLAHSLKNLQDEINFIASFPLPNQPPVKILVLPVMVSSSRQPEAVEQRMRTREAVIEALVVAGFVASDSDDIGFAMIPWDFKEVFATKPSLKDLQKGGEWESAWAMPYEWYQPTYAPIAYGAGARPNRGTAEHSPAKNNLDLRQRTGPPDSPVLNMALVLWLPEEAFEDTPLVRLAQFMKELKLPLDQVSIGLIGPRHWNTLESMIAKADPGVSPEIKEALAPIKMYIATPTPEDSYLLFQAKQKGGISSIEEFWRARFSLKETGGAANPGSQPAKSPAQANSPQQASSPPTTSPKPPAACEGMKVIRVSLPDDKLIKSIVEELALRNVHIRCTSKTSSSNQDSEKQSGGNAAQEAPDQIAVIAESDTPFGRSIRYSLSAGVSGTNVNKLLVEGDDPALPKHIHFYSYLRGLDGQLPGSPAPTPESGKGEGESGGAAAKGKPGSMSAIGRQSGASGADPSPDGYNQTDYLQRLGETMQQQERVLKLDNKGGFKAIGILGSDLYDKLLILRVLRKRFPSAVFFTTTADARYTMPEDWPEAHNLVIVSDYGLELGEDYQCGIPPFRDSQQTAVFAATLASANVLGLEQGAIELEAPRVFEVARGRLFDISPDAKGPPLVSASDRDQASVAASTSLHPWREDLTPWWNNGRLFWWFIVAAIISTLLAALMYLMQSHQRTLPARHFQESAFLTGWKFAGLAAISILVTWLFYCFSLHHDKGKGEPFSLIGGISVWPSEAIRQLAGWVSLLCLLCAKARTDRNDQFIQKHFCLKPPTASVPRRVRWGWILGEWKVTTKVQHTQPVITLAGVLPSRADEMVDAQKLWEAYVTESNSQSRVIRTIVVGAAYYLLLLAIGRLSGKPTPPCRGPVCDFFDSFTNYYWAIPLSIALTYYVIDGTFTNCRFIRYLTQRKTQWCADAYKMCEDRGLTDAEDLRELLDIRLIAQRTAVVGEFIYFPFVVMGLLIVSRISYFGNWSWPPGQIIMYLASTLFTVASVFMLRHAAEKARRGAIESLREREIYHAAHGESGKSQAVNECISEIEGERRGAFSLLSQHPIVASILLPSGGVGIWALLQYVATSAS